MNNRVSRLEAKGIRLEAKGHRMQYTTLVSVLLHEAFRHHRRMNDKSIATRGKRKTPRSDGTSNITSIHTWCIVTAREDRGSKSVQLTSRSYQPNAERMCIHRDRATEISPGPSNTPNSQKPPDDPLVPPSPWNNDTTVRISKSISCNLLMPLPRYPGPQCCVMRKCNRHSPVPPAAPYCVFEARVGRVATDLAGPGPQQTPAPAG